MGHMAQVRNLYKVWIYYTILSRSLLKSKIRAGSQVRNKKWKFCFQNLKRPAKYSFWALLSWW